jgi:hypothetical protein
MSGTVRVSGYTPGPSHPPPPLVKMRLWSFHPKYLDPAGLVAAWREALLARAVLDGETKGYRNHPQLVRFREQALPAACIALYLRALLEEANSRSYSFDRTKVPSFSSVQPIPVTRGQLDYEWQHLLGKVEKRNSAWFDRLRPIRNAKTHPLFTVVPGPLATWEKVPR